MMMMMMMMMIMMMTHVSCHTLHSFMFSALVVFGFQVVFSLHGYLSLCFMLHVFFLRQVRHFREILRQTENSRLQQVTVHRTTFQPIKKKYNVRVPPSPTEYPIHTLTVTHSLLSLSSLFHSTIILFSRLLSMLVSLIDYRQSPPLPLPPTYPTRPRPR
jgi:transcriptional regulatory protein LevR